MNILASVHPVGETLAELPTEQFPRFRDQQDPAALIQPISEPSWCVRCSPPDGHGNDFDPYAHLHIGELHTVTDVTVEVAPDGEWSGTATASVEIERLDYDIPGAPYRGLTCIRLNAHDAVMTPEGAIRYAEAVIAVAKVAIASRGGAA
jgi:hypothetical protein